MLSENFCLVMAEQKLLTYVSSLLEAFQCSVAWMTHHPTLFWWVLIIYGNRTISTKNWNQHFLVKSMNMDFHSPQHPTSHFPPPISRFISSNMLLFWQNL